MQWLIGVTRIYWKHAAILFALGPLLQFASADAPGQAGAQHSLGWARDEAAPLHVAKQAPKRPRVTGVAYVRLYSGNVEKSRAFYSGVLGLPSSGGSCSGVALPCLLVNSSQRIELQPVVSPAPNNWLAEIGYATDDVSQLHAYLLAHGVVAGAISKDGGGQPQFALHDPEGNPIAFVQKPMAMADDKTSPNQMSRRLIHAGFVVKDMAAENRFYVDLLGFKLYWYGGFKDDGVDWYELQVPDGDNWIEYMLNIPATADHQALGVQNHFSFGVPEIQAAAEQLRKNGAEKIAGPGIGRDGKRGLNVYDPDDTRVEVTEFTPAREPCCHPYTAPHPTP
jgi:catechol 2,3-dioxygenase-like lactoylglutathione lyase family enzyme